MDIDIFARFILVFSSLFVIVDPIAAVPVFAALTSRHSKVEISRIALRATVFGSAVLIFFSLFGVWIFRFLQIDMNAFKAAGGLLLLLTALDMLRAKSDRCAQCSPEELASPSERDDISFVPVALPMLAGPGAITSTVVFSTDHLDGHLVQFLILLAAIAMTFGISFVLLRASGFIKNWLGHSGISVTQRVMGLLLAALSLQFLTQGLSPLLNL